MKHEWINSTLGHGEQMCKYCFGTNRELAALGLLDYCDKAPQPPKQSEQEKSDDGMTE